MHMIKFNDIWEQKLFPLLIGRGWKYCRGGEDIVGVKISSHTGKLSFFIIYKFWQNCASVRQVSDLILKTADILVNIGSGDGLLPDGTKPLPEAILTYN